MKKDKHAGNIKGFHHLSRAWYAKSEAIWKGEGENPIDHVMIGFYCPTGGTSGEFCVRWLPVGGDLAPHLEVFDDAWDALANMPELIKAMAEIKVKNITPNAFCQMLVSIGFTDLTKEVQP